jgi:hypothetical protein
MATPKKKYPYNFVYRDGRYVEFHLTKDDFEDVCEAKMSGKDTVRVSIGFIEIKDVVTAVEKVVPKQAKEKEEREERDDEAVSFSKMFNTPPVDVESEEYLRRVLANIWEEGDVQ